MKVTLDHDCLIHVEDSTAIGHKILQIAESSKYECYIVNIGASEMQQRGILPDRYDLFEEFLGSIRLDNLPRLNPMGLYDVTFYDRCLCADQSMVDLSRAIGLILFGDLNGKEASQADSGGVNSKTINRICDIHTMWCHIHYGNQLFLTTDRNFMKATKRPKLLGFGAGRIAHPDEL